MDELEIVIPLEPVVASRPRAVAGRGAYYLPKYEAYRQAAALVLAGLLRDTPPTG